jgi:hypothetical protein
VAVDPTWLADVRAKNKAAIGLQGMNGLGAQDIVTSMRGERELRTQSIHRGRFERRDPHKPAEGSIESIAKAIGPANVPQVRPVPKALTWAFGLAVVGLVGFIGYRLVKKG